MFLNATKVIHVIGKLIQAIPPIVKAEFWEMLQLQAPPGFFLTDVA